MRPRAGTALARTATVMVLAALCSPARAGRSLEIEAVHAARMLSSWRYDEARELIAKLAGEAPDSVEVRYLQGELAFLDGDYGAALEHLDGVDDSEIAGNVGSLRSLAASTFETTRGFAVASSPAGRFQIHYPTGKDEVIVELAGEVLDAAYNALAADLEFSPPTPIRVELLPRPSDLASVSTLTVQEIETTGTIALCKYNKLMVVTPRATVFGYPWMDTLTHEYVHYVVSLMSRDQVPVWLHEGLAKYLQVRWRSAASGALSKMDEHLLASALKRDKLIDFGDLHPSMAKLPSQEAAALGFAEVFSMVAFIHEQVGNEGLREIIALHKEGKDTHRAVAQTVGGSWSDIESSWRRKLRSSSLQISDDLSGRASSRRIRFKKGDKDDENVGIDEVSSERARKLTRVAGMLRANGHTAAAAVEYEKAIAIVGDKEPFVAGKLSRTYLDLGKYEKAIGLAEPLVDYDENDPAPPTTLGIAHLANGNLPRARNGFERALRINPFDPAVRCGLAEAYGRLGDKKRANREQKACEILRR